MAAGMSDDREMRGLSRTRLRPWRALALLLVALLPAIGFDGSRARQAGGSGEDVVPLSRLVTKGGKGYSPAQLEASYGLTPVYAAGLNGAGTTIGIVDVYGSPEIRANLSRFDARYHIPPPPSFTIVKPAGPVPAFQAKNTAMVGWAVETTLDVEWAHALAPRARIVLALTGVDEVEGTSGMAQLMKAEEFLVNHEHVDVLSQSFGATEETFPSERSLLSFRAAFHDAFSHKVTVLAAAGDDGASGPQLDPTVYYDRRVVAWPASDPLVTAVGGTQLALDSAGHEISPPRVWDVPSSDVPVGGGGGVSAYFGRPSYQNTVRSVVGVRRGIPDVSLDASCSSPAALYADFPGAPVGLGQACGTSVAAPMFAAVVALADQLHGGRLGFLNPLLYRLGATHAPGLVDVRLGSNTVSVSVDGRVARVAGYQAHAGFDLASGWGTIDAAKLVPELAGRPLP